MPGRLRVLVIGGLLTCAGCTSGAVARDAATQDGDALDAATPSDAARIDDASPWADAGRDAAPADAAWVVDASADAWARSIDAGTDASPPDAGGSIDAGTDASLTDAGGFPVWVDCSTVTPDAEVSVSITTGFLPRTTSIVAGQVVRWTNMIDVRSHSVTSDTFEFDFVVPTNGTTCVRWPTAGTFPYHSQFSTPSLMVVGTVIVTGP